MNFFLFFFSPITFLIKVSYPRSYLLVLAIFQSGLSFSFSHMRIVRGNNKFATNSHGIYRDVANHLGTRDCGEVMMNRE